MNGVINIYKNKGMTSFDVVRQVKKVAKTGKVGHTGTLDPEAEGVLPVCIGKATKIIDYIMDSAKIYKVTFKLGVVTTTYDMEGEVLKESETSHLTEEDILNAIYKFRGEYSQVPPMFSALKQNGVRLYELARKGIEVERPGRNITIYNIEDIQISSSYITMTVTCSKGTYIRSLCYDIGAELGVGGTMTDLKRVKTSEFHMEDSVNIEDLNEDNILQYLITIDDALSSYKELIIKNSYSKLLINGVKVGDKRFTDDKVSIGELYRVYDEDRTFIGLGRSYIEGFKIEKLLIY